MDAGDPVAIVKVCITLGRSPFVLDIFSAVFVINFILNIVLFISFHEMQIISLTHLFAHTTEPRCMWGGGGGGPGRGDGSRR